MFIHTGIPAFPRRRLRGAAAAIAEGCRQLWRAQFVRSSWDPAARRADGEVRSSTRLERLDPSPWRT